MVFRNISGPDQTGAEFEIIGEAITQGILQSIVAAYFLSVLISSDLLRGIMRESLLFTILSAKLTHFHDIFATDAINSAIYCLGNLAWIKCTG